MALLTYYETHSSLSDLPGGENIKNGAEEEMEDGSSVEEVEGPKRRYSARNKK